MTPLKGTFPFRLGTTSYIRPADILENAEFLKEIVDDIELLLFESDEISNLPDAETVNRLRAIALEHGLTYTVHLPLDIDPASEDPGTRSQSVAKCLRITELVAPLDPFAYILHLYAPGASRFSEAERSSWRSRAGSSASALVRDSAVPPQLFCVETLDFGFTLAEPIVNDHGLSICLDVGHLWRCGFPVDDHLRRYLGLTRVMHLHGVQDGRDHLDLSVLDPTALAAVTSALVSDGTTPRVLTIEVFSEPDLNLSLRALASTRDGAHATKSGDAS